jgi:hypothetical protein
MISFYMYLSYQGKLLSILSKGATVHYSMQAGCGVNRRNVVSRLTVLRVLALC